MDMVLFIIGLLLFVGSLVYLVVSLIKKRFTKKKFIGALASGFALMIIGLSIPSSTETVSEPSQAEKEKEPELTPEQIAANEKSEADKKAKEEAEQSQDRRRSSQSRGSSERSYGRNKRRTSYRRRTKSGTRC